MKFTQAPAIAATLALIATMVLAPRAMAQAQPYTLEDISVLVEGGVSPDRVLSMAQASCISFRTTAATNERLRALGASQALIAGLGRACYRGSDRTERAKPRPAPRPPTPTVPGGPTAVTQVRLYRYWLNKRSGEPRFAGELARPSASGGRHYTVEIDPRGRIKSIATVRDRKKVSETIYHFAGAALLPDSYETYGATGELETRARVTRNELGERTGLDFSTPSGERDGRLSRTLQVDVVESDRYNRHGSRTSHQVSRFSPTGVLTQARLQSYEGDSVAWDYQYSEDTGLTSSTKELRGGRVTFTMKYAYDSDGSVLREDIYDASDSWIGAKEYADGLETVTRYKLSDRSEERRPTYDERRLRKETKFYVNGVLICTFVYDRFADGRLKRTLAIAPSGELLAEYPELYVEGVANDGYAVGHRGVGTIHKKTAWW